MSKTQFDRQDVLHKATSLFWRVGYNATSMQALFKVTGLKPGSVYLAFGNKEGLFKESLKFYASASIDKLNKKFKQNQSVEKIICDLLFSFVEEAVQSEYCSCYLVKSQLELDDQPQTKHYIAEYLAAIEKIYVEQLATIYPVEEAQIKAMSIMIHIFGLRVYGYHTQNKQSMLSSLQLGLPWLPWPS
ncbi:TetR/AcrR family transcriptional regulator [Colwellia sp. C1TZA3]|uniref:TetR/AcrR family transcriptional regulator n=1 Tax=Colwellia sp. C1TZA3 TaxID=2508879 RepID=UPI0011B986B2|nr:TetR/AcrR family transcriptional regulator [Colwellia sp. C1TZA3]TWX70431.1 TetR/AcrR family transcriptional regulator [Colwellia sp. C1TZA3]